MKTVGKERRSLIKTWATRAAVAHTRHPQGNYDNIYVTRGELGRTKRTRFSCAHMFVRLLDASRTHDVVPVCGKPLNQNIERSIK